MGVDFIRQKVSDHRKKYAAMARTGSQDLFVDPAARATQVVRASTSADDPLQIGDCVIVRRDDSGSIVASKDTRVVARLLKASRRLDKKLDSQAGCATATVHALFPETQTADLKLEH